MKAHQDAEIVPAGTYLKRRLGGRLFTIGNLIGRGDVPFFHTLASLRPSPDSIDELVGRLGAPGFLLDLRTAPDRQARWLRGVQQIGPEFQGITSEPGKAFDALLYFDAVTPALENRQ